MITLKKQIELSIDNQYEGFDIFTKKDIERIQKKYSKELETNNGMLSQAHLETIRLFYIRKFEIFKAITLLNNLNEAIEQFNELEEFARGEQIYENSIDTWEFLKTTNSEEELIEAKANDQFDSNKKWIRFDYGAYAISMNDDEVIKHIKQSIELYEEHILG